MGKTVQIQIKNLRLRTIIGVNEWERKNKQDVIITISFIYDASDAIHNDDLGKAVNYKQLTKQIISVVESAQYKLLESLADRILDVIREHPGIQDPEVRVEKPHALRFSDTVSCTITDASSVRARD